MLTAEQMEIGRRQLEIEQSLLAQGMPPRQAAEMAARQVMPAPQEREYESFPPPRKVADPAYEGYSDEELATIYGIEAERAMVGQPYSKSRQTNVRQELRLRGLEAGNGADLDNLAAAATEFGVEPEFGGAREGYMPGSSASILAAREAAAKADWEARGRYYGARAKEYTEKYGMVGTPGAAPLTDAQIANREQRKQSEYDLAVAQRGRPDFYEERRRAEAGLPPAAFEDPAKPTIKELERAAYRQRYDQRQADLDARQQAVVRRRMAQTNPLEYMNRDDISDWNRMVTADQLLRRGYRGATPLDVDQAREQALALQESRRGLGQGFQQPTPAQQRAQNAQADAAEAEAADVTYTSARGIVGQYAADKSWTNFLSRVTSGGTDFHDPTVFTAAERQKAIAQLMARYPHLTEAEAAGIIDAAASNTTYVE